MTNKYKMNIPAYLIFSTSFILSLRPFTIAFNVDTIINISNTENDAFGISVYNGNLLIASPELSVKKLPGYMEIKMKKAYQK
jgi:hypothetical protein